MSRTLLARRFVVSLFALLPAAVAAQHALPAAGVFFDDFSYRNTRPPINGAESRPFAENALFGTNTWCLDLGCARSVPARGWYWYNAFEPYFQRVDSLTTLRATPGGPLAGTLDFTIGQGRHRPGDTAQRQVATGFAAGDGLWAARATFSALPNGLPPDLVPAGTPPRVSMMQSVWMISPGRAVRTLNPGTPSHEQRYGGTELDFEYTNWFFDSGRPRYMATGYIENDEDSDGDGYWAVAARLVDPVPSDAPLHSCRIARAGRPAETATPDACDAVIAGLDAEAGPDLPVTLVLRRARARVRFEVHADWEAPRGHGSLTMVSRWVEIAGQPSQITTLMLSAYLVSHDEAVVDVPAAQRMRVDWVYFTPDAARPLEEVRDDVALIRRRRLGGRPAVSRLFTIPASDPAAQIERPFRLRRDGDAGSAPLVPTEPVEVREIRGPRTADLGGPLEYAAVLGRLSGDFTVEWRTAVLDAAGHASPPTPYDNTPGIRFRPVVAGAPPCIRVDARATRLDYHSGPDGVWWTPAPGADGQPDRAERSVVTCATGQPRPPGT